MLESLDIASTQGDKTFSVPGASGCRGLFAPIVDAILNNRLGLPSGSGHNSIVLNNSNTQVGSFVDPSSVAPHEGQALSADWHSAIKS